jgi:hypothetical protein
MPQGPFDPGTGENGMLRMHFALDGIVDGADGGAGAHVHWGYSVVENESRSFEHSLSL